MFKSKLIMIISLSLPESLVTELKQLEEKLGFSGRSDLMRAAIRCLQDEEKAKGKLQGIIDAVLMIKHKEKYSQDMLELRHKHQSLIQTHLHTHLENHHCLELLMLKGEAEKIKKLAEAFETSKKVDLVKLSVV